jgi:hypothetical protein
MRTERIICTGNTFVPDISEILNSPLCGGISVTVCVAKCPFKVELEKKQVGYRKPGECEFSRPKIAKVIKYKKEFLC